MAEQTAPGHPSDSSTLDRILQAARACFRRNGVRETKMGDIAAEAGVVRQTLYDWVSSRDALVEMAMAQRIHELAAQFQAMPMDPRLSVSDQLVDVLAAMAETAVADEEFESLAQALPEREAFRFLAGPSELTEAVVDILTPLFDRARDEGTLRADMGTRSIAEWVQLVLAPLRYRDGLDPLTLRATLRFFLLPAILRDQR